MFVLMPEPCEKCYSVQKYILTLFMGVKIAHFCHFSLVGNLEFVDFLQKSFKTLMPTGRENFSDLSMTTTMIHLNLHPKKLNSKLWTGGTNV